MKYNVEVVETLNRIITVEAPTADLARARAVEAYNAEEIVLDHNDCTEGAQFEVLTDDVPDDFPVDYTVK